MYKKRKIYILKIFDKILIFSLNLTKLKLIIDIKRKRNCIINNFP